MPNNFKLYTT